MSIVQFTKMAGAGNDFIIVDNRNGTLTVDPSLVSRQLSRRKQSVGADGLILLEASKKADARMRIFNPDGSEAEMCGNGVRCLAKFAADNKITGNRLSIETPAGIIGAEVNGEIVKVRMADPFDLKLGLRLDINGVKTDINFINTGVPHAVVIAEALDELDVFTLGRAIRRHSHFAPAGANANFISVIQSGNAIRIRTYERGVEDETLSCGTGSTAGALIAAALKGFRSPVTVHTKSGEALSIHFNKDGEKFNDVYLEGPVQKSFEGRVNL